MILPSPLPIPPKLIKAEPTSLKRSAPEDDDVLVVEPPAKRAKTNGSSVARVSQSSKLEEDGIELVEDDVVIIE